MTHDEEIRERLALLPQEDQIRYRMQQAREAAADLSRRVRELESALKSEYARGVADERERTASRLEALSTVACSRMAGIALKEAAAEIRKGPV